MRSSDAGGFTGDADPVRPDGTEPVDPSAMPPSDPWLAAAPTSTLDLDATSSLDRSPAKTWPIGPVATDGSVGAAPFRPARWVLALVVLVTVVGCLGVAVFDQFGSDDGANRATGPGGQAGAGSGPGVADPGVADPDSADPDSADPGVADPGSATGATQGGRTPADPGPTGADERAAGLTGSSAPPPGLLVIYEVTASGSGNVGNVQYTDRDGDIIRRGGVPLPWRLTFRVTGQRAPLVLIAQRRGGGDTGPVTCSITAGGKVLGTATQTGRFAAPQCSG